MRVCPLTPERHEQRRHKEGRRLGSSTSISLVSDWADEMGVPSNPTGPPEDWLRTRIVLNTFGATDPNSASQVRIDKKMRDTLDRVVATLHQLSRR
jgi:hypothetical protein